MDNHAPPEPDARARLTHDQAQDLVLRIVSTQAESLLRTAYRNSLCADDAHDAYQRSMEIFLRRAQTLDPRSAHKWIHVVVKREAQALRRARSGSVSYEAVDFELHAASEVSTPEERVLAKDRARRAAEALRRLKPQERRAMGLKAFGHSYAEIGEVTGFSGTKINRCLTEGRKSFLERFEGIEAGVECQRWRPVLSAMVSGEATAAQITEARPHLRNCPACKATLRASASVAPAAEGRAASWAGEPRHEAVGASWSGCCRVSGAATQAVWPPAGRASWASAEPSSPACSRRVRWRRRAAGWWWHMTAPVATPRRCGPCAPRRREVLWASLPARRISTAPARAAPAKVASAAAWTVPARRCPCIRQAAHRVRPAWQRSHPDADGSHDPESGPRSRSTVRSSPAPTARAESSRRSPESHPKNLHTRKESTLHPLIHGGHRRHARIAIALGVLAITFAHATPSHAGGTYIHKSCVTGADIVDAYGGWQASAYSMVGNANTNQCAWGGLHSEMNPDGWHPDRRHRRLDLHGTAEHQHLALRERVRRLDQDL